MHQIKLDPKDAVGCFAVTEEVANSMNYEDIFVFRANNGNHFLKEGIHEGDYIFGTSELPFLEGALNILYCSTAKPKFKISKVELPNFDYAGRVIYRLGKCGGGENV
jgi:hypothetical protein